MNLLHALSAFLTDSPTSFHATKACSSLLLAAGFEPLHEHLPWQCVPGGRYFYIRSGAIVAFTMGNETQITDVRLIGAHTDSPNLKVKPKPVGVTKGYLQLGIQVYGGALLNPWFDRDLSLAGKVSYLDGQGKVAQILIDFKRPIGSIPSLAIHLDRQANENRTVNAQTDMNVLLGRVNAESGVAGAKPDFSDMLMTMVCDAIGVDSDDPLAPKEVLSHDLSFYDCQAPATVGLDSEFFASARLDNLLSCFVAIRALIDSPPTYPAIVVLNDHEEVGSRSDSGAMGTMLGDLLVRLIPDSEKRQIALRRSLMLSIDNAHGVHPNFVSRHDDKHGPLLNAGPVIKADANQSYATNSETEALVKALARGDAHKRQIPLQSFAVKADMRCGSTIGPITAANIGIPTVDIGVSTFAMHSIRELAGVDDVTHLYELATRFLASDLTT